MNRAYRFRLYPKKGPAEELGRALELCRRLYNAAKVLLGRVGRGTAEFTPPKRGPTRVAQAPASPLVERGSPGLQAGEDVTGQRGM